MSCTVGETPAGRNFKVKNVFCFKLDAKSVPEALATTIRILLMFSIALVHQRGPEHVSAPHTRGGLMWLPGHSWAPMGAHGTAGARLIPNHGLPLIPPSLGCLFMGGGFKKFFF